MKKHLLIIVLTIFCLSNTFSQTFNETEPNDSFEQAELVTAPVTIIATSGSEDDVDFFKVDLSSSAVITITLSEIQANQYFRLYAYNSNEDQIGFVQSPEDGTGYTYDFLLPSGISYFKIYDYGNNPSSIAYHLELEIDTSDGCEINNSFETACLVSPDAMLHPQLFGYNSDLGGSDTDYYKLELPVGGVVTVNLSNLAVDQYLRLYAYNSNEGQIAFVQSPEDGSGFSIDLLLPPGISYFVLTDYSSIKSDSIHLDLELVFDSTDGCEINNSFETACLVSPDAILHPQLFGYNSDLGGADTDYYKLDLPVGGVVTVNLSNLAVDQYLRLYAYNSNEDQIAFVQSPEDGSGFSIDLLLPPGISYFALTNYSSIKSDSIHLDLELRYDTSDGCELNNSFETACLVESDTVLHPQLFGYNSDLGGNDTDYYKVEAGIILNQCFTISNVQPDQYIRLYVYDEDYNQIGFEQSPDDGSGFFYCLDLGLDLFYFKLYDYGAASNSEPLTVILAGVSGLSAPTIGQTENLISVYPNPTSGSFTLTFPETSTQIQVLNSLGQVIESIQVYRQEQLELALEAEGIYFIKINTENDIVIKKLVVHN